MVELAGRLEALRNELAKLDLQGFVVPLTDEYLSEDVGAYAQRLAWLTGFRGSAGWAVVLPTDAAVFVDGRYTLQVREEVDLRLWQLESLSQVSAEAWLGQRASPGWRIGYDPWLHTPNWVGVTRRMLAKRNAKLIAVEANPIDMLWNDRPSPSESKLILHPEAIAGRSSMEKRLAIADWLRVREADAVVLASLDSIAWLFNVRGADIEHTPVARAYTLVTADGTADLFVDPQKLTEEAVEHLGPTVRLHPHTTFIHHLHTLAGKRIVIDPERAVAAIFEALEAGDTQLIEARDPVVLPKAIKNEVEIAGHRIAQVRDGASLCRFLHWFSLEARRGTLTEISAANKLREFREATGALRDLSFDTISGAGPNGALPHYGVTEQTNRIIELNSLYLVDSGGQYIDGTTDVTRTVAIGTPTAEMCDRFTRVLKGHIALASAVFPVGTRGVQLDLLARQPLWAAGLDYPHGTGHGVGSYLGVHEGPQRIAPTSGPTGDCAEPLVSGMILSNEPGYYKAGEYGIRIENLMLVVTHTITGSERSMLAFDTLTLAPIDRALIDVLMLTVEERAWLDAYHARVAATIGPVLEGAARAWLVKATERLND